MTHVLCPASGERVPKSAGPVVVCPECGAHVKLYGGRLVRHGAPSEIGDER